MIKQGDEYTEPEEPNIDEYRKEQGKLKENSLKHCGLITQYLSEESFDEVKRQDKWKAINQAADPVGLWRLVEATHKSFKAEIINGLTAGSITQPKDLSAMYLLANQWLKTAKSHPTGLATIFNTRLDLQDPQDKKSKGDCKQKAKGGKKQQEEQTSGKKDASEVEPFNSGIVGHYANKCPHKLDKLK